MPPRIPLAILATKAHGEFVHHYTQVLTRRAAFQQVSLLSGLVYGVITPQLQDSTPVLVELYDVYLCPTLQPLQILLNSSRVWQCASYSSEFSRFTEWFRRKLTLKII